MRPTALALAAVLSLTSVVAAQRTAPLTGDRLSGTVLPVTPDAGDLVITGLKAWSWRVDDTQRLLVEGDATVRIGGNEFRANDAAVWINRLPSDRGPITQIAVYFDDLRNPTRRSGSSAAGRRLLVTASVLGRTTLDVARLESNAPASGRGILRRGEERLEAHRRRLAAGDAVLSDRPQLETPPPPPPPFRPEPGGRVDPDVDLPTRVALPASGTARPWLRDPTGVLRFAFGSAQLETGTEENVITFTDGVVIEYIAGPRGDDALSDITLAADRAVIYADPGSVQDLLETRLDAALVRGIYLEGNVAVDANEGAYHVRSPYVYYDFRTDRALMVDALLRTYDRDMRIPIHARAEELRQVAADQWIGERARVSTSEFRVGHLALGAERVTITQRPDPESPDDRQTYFDAEDITLRAGDVPFFVWPRFRGTARDVPLRSLGVGSDGNEGVQIRTGWNAFALLGRDAPAGVDAEFKLDGYTKRGVGVGLEMKYDVAAGYGTLDLYGLLDQGEDRTSAGLDVEPERDERGIALWEHQWNLARDWTLQMQGAWISDPTYVSSWREDDFRERREYESSAYLKYQWDRRALTFLTTWHFNDFIANDWQLASAPYRTEKVGEVAYRNLADPWFNDRIVYDGDTRLTRQHFVLDDTTPEELGVRGRAFGIPDDQAIGDELRALGYRTEYVTRLDSRHELSMPLDWGPIRIVPFGVARYTAYDEDLERPSGAELEDTTRFFGALGVRMSTRIQRVDDTVENRLLDLHRMRHIIEPSLTAWYGYSDINSNALPIYDPEVESLGEGTALRLGVRNTFQTQRGGPGRWRSVDVFTLDTDVVLNSNDVDREAPVPQWFEARPENSQFGDHALGRGLWRLSDTLFLSGEATWDLDADRMSRSSAGIELRHAPQFTTYLEYRSIDASDNELIEAGWDYRVSQKYRLVLVPQWDLRRDEFRAANVRVIRTFPDFDLSLLFRYDQVRDTTSFGASIDLVEF